MLGPRLLSLVLLLLTAAGCSPRAQQAAPTGAALDPADFYRGKSIDLLVGFSEGGGYDTYARLLARHISKHVPGNPTVEVRNVDGAGSILAVNQLYNTEPQDGTVIATFARGIPLEQIASSPSAHFDVRQMNWIGSMNNEVSICVARADSPVHTFADLKASPLLIGGVGPASDTDHFPRVLDAVLGTKFDIVTGYPGGNEINAAMERGEVDGRCGMSWSTLTSTRPDWIGQPPFINILVQLSLKKHPDIPQEVPLILEFAQTDEQRQLLEAIFSGQPIGRPYAMGPAVPADRVQAIREAFMQTMADPEFLAEARQQRVEINAVAGDEVQAIIRRILAMPPNVASRVGELIRVD
jgi:tripartite-type tricarboxylate transporter receptor subunit TctC